MRSKVKLAIIDSHALIHRAFHALPPMSTRAGLPTNAVYGFTVMLLKVLTTLKPTHVVAAFDRAGPTFRSEEFKDYKAHRKPADPQLVKQFDVVRRLVKAFNIPILDKEGFEADDIIGTLVKTLGSDVYKIIVTGDMDALQLVNDTTVVFTLKKGITDTITYDEAVVKEKYGFAPQFIPDYKGLRGDPSDNIPGVKGVGEKTAKELIARYGSIEKIYENFDLIPTKLQKKIKDQQKDALFSRRLATIRQDVPFEFSLQAAEVDDYDQAEVKALLEELEFKSLLQRLPNSKNPTQPTLFKDAETSEKLPENYYLVETAQDAEVLKKELKKHKLISFDTETEFLSGREAPIIGMSFAIKKDGKIHAWYVPTDTEKVKEWADILEDPKILKIGHNLKYDAEVLRQSGITLNKIGFDSMLGSYLLNPSSRQHGLDALAIQELQYHPIPITDLIGSGKDQKKMTDVPLLALARYAAEDADVALRLYEHLQPRLKDEGLIRVLDELEVPLIPVLSRMETRGIRLDTAVLKKLEKKLSKRIEKLQQQIQEAAGEEFNIKSTQQLRRILFEKLQLPTQGIARTQSGYSTAAPELEKLEGVHPIIEYLSEYREVTKLLSTYILTLPTLVDKKTGRLYTSFNQTVAATGRLSSHDPNLQNIPVRTELGQEIRAAFIADKGNVLIKADYSQLELRLAAHISQDPKMLEAFRAGEDIHRATAAWVYGIKPEEVTTEQRRVAKTLNFGVLYGMGPRKFARESKVSMDQARMFIDRYREEYTGLTRLLTETIAQAKELGYVTTLFGRKRYIPEISATSAMVRSQAERIAFNFPMQGTEADILKKAMIELDAALQAEFPKAELVLSVHDELVVEAPKKQALEIAKVMKDVMERVMTLDIPLDVEVAIGDNWRDTQPVII